MARMGAKVTAFDFSEEMISLARKGDMQNDIDYRE